MSVTLPEGLKAILDDKPYVIIATLMPDGSPQQSPVWAKRDGDDVLMSTTLKRQKELNLRKDPRVSLLVHPSPFVYAEIRGTATISPDDDKALINELSVLYTGKPYAEFNPHSVHDTPRIVVRVSPLKIHTQAIG